MTEQSDQQYPIVLNSKNIEQEKTPNKKTNRNQFFVKTKTKESVKSKKITQQKEQQIFHNQILKQETNDSQRKKIQYQRIHRLKQLLNFNDSVRMNFINQNLDAMLMNFRNNKEVNKHKITKIVPISTQNIENYKNKSVSSQNLICDSSFSIQKNSSLSLQNKNYKQNQIQPQEYSLNSVRITNISLKKQKQSVNQETNKSRKLKKISLQRINFQQEKSSRSYEKYKKANIFCKCQQKHFTNDKNIYFPAISQIQHIPQIKFKTKDNCNPQKRNKGHNNSKTSFFTNHFQSRVRKNNQLKLIQSSNTKYDLKQKTRKNEKKKNEIKFKKSENSLIDFVY